MVDEPMVAFVCNRPAMHSTDGGWVSDDSANCISDPVDILNYCRKVSSPPPYLLVIRLEAIGFRRILDSLQGAIRRCSRVRL